MQQAPKAASVDASGAAATTGVAEMNFATTAAAPVGSETINLPLPEILRGLPNELGAGVMRQPAMDDTVTLPLSVILPQVTTGMVKIPFGQLRMACPKGTFLDSPVYDHKVITLPLAVILPRINPALLKRRSDQRHSIDPASFETVFARMGSGNGEQPDRVNARNLATQGPETQSHPVAAHVSNPFSTIPASAMPGAAPAPAPLPFARTSEHFEAAKPPSAASPDVLWIPLHLLSTYLPNEVQKVLTGPELEKGKIGIPMSEMETGLKGGRLTFPWKQIRAWIQPAPPEEDGVEDILVTLPLQIIVPLFLAKRRDGKGEGQKRIVLNHDIPDVFKMPSSSPGTAVAVASPIVGAPSVSEQKAHLELHADQVPAAFPRQNNAAAEAGQKTAVPAGQPDKTSWTPEEVVEKAIKLPGVIGALVSLQDGLLVTGQVPAGVDAETLAAFLPQIFGRMAHYARELKLAAPLYVGLEAAEYSLHIHKTGEVYFLAMGAAGTQSPLVQLGQLAAKLKRPSGMN